MKARIISDLHNEFGYIDIKQHDEDIVIANGDIDVELRGAHYLISKFKNIPIIYISGNHEYYGSEYSMLNDRLKELNKIYKNFHFLNNDIFEIDNYKFLGSTLWTDYNILPNTDVNMAMLYANKMISDHKAIKYFGKIRNITPSDMKLLHNKSIKFLKKELNKNDDKKNIVITHHAPSEKCLSTEYKNDRLNPAFASNLENLIKEYQPEYWIYGHTHYNNRFKIGKTKVLSNQRGYQFENHDNFDKDFVMDI